MTRMLDSVNLLKIDFRAIIEFSCAHQLFVV